MQLFGRVNITIRITHRVAHFGQVVPNETLRELVENWVDPEPVAKSLPEITTVAEPQLFSTESGVDKVVEPELAVEPEPVAVERRAEIPDPVFTDLPREPEVIDEEPVVVVPEPVLNVPLVIEEEQVNDTQRIDPASIKSVYRPVVIDLPAIMARVDAARKAASAAAVEADVEPIELELEVPAPVDVVEEIEPVVAELIDEPLTVIDRSSMKIVSGNVDWDLAAMMAAADTANGKTVAAVRPDMFVEETVVAGTQPELVSENTEKAI